MAVGSTHHYRIANQGASPLGNRDEKDSPLESLSGEALDFSWSRDGKFLATGCADKTARVWDASGKLVKTLEGHTGPVSVVAIGADGRIASASHDKTVHLWSTNGEKLRHTLGEHTHPIRAVTWSRDGRWLVSGGDDRKAIIGSPESGKSTRIIDTPLRHPQFGCFNRGQTVGRR